MQTGQSAADERRLGLLERDELLDGLARAFADAAAGHGRLLLLGGEAGVGKTALLRAFCGPDLPARVLWGACERLFTPRALGPFLDVADAAGVGLTGLSPHARAPSELFGALAGELTREPPTVLVVEDVHWADVGTLDVVKLLARRIESLPVLALVSFRDDQVSPTAPLQIVLGELAGARGVERRHIPPLSLEAVRALAAPWGADADRLFARTGGNPFYVTEALAARDLELPASVRGAVLARAAQLSAPARRLLDAAAVVPARIELWLLEAIAGPDLAALEDVREGDSRRWLSRLAWFAGDRGGAVHDAQRAVGLLEAEPPGPELAMAYSNQAQLCMLADDTDGAVESGTRAIDLAERLGETEILVHALNNVGSAEAARKRPGGVAKLERSLALALDSRLEEHVARGYTNLGAGAVRARNYARAERDLAAGIAYCEEHDLDAWVPYMTGWLARMRLEQGRWDEAADHATRVLGRANVAVASRIMPLAVLGRLRARRGDPDPWHPLDEALELARRTEELQRLAPVAAARAEAHWLEGKLALVGEDTDEAFSLALESGDAWALGELHAWRRRAGVQDSVEDAAVAAPYASELRDDWATAAREWEEHGCPYEAALARADSGEEALLEHALASFQRLGALPAARATARRLRLQGVRSIARGPRRSTIDNPGQLTSRQIEILALVADGLTNAEIAARLYITPKTAAHHVSAILAKLDVRSRRQAAAQAAGLGLVTSPLALAGSAAAA